MNTPAAKQAIAMPGERNARYRPAHIAEVMAACWAMVMPADP